MATTQTSQEICGQCAHWSRLTDDRLPDHGGCAYRPTGHYTHGQRACITRPVRFQAKSRKEK